jgi:hypothetical protein
MRIFSNKSFQFDDPTGEQLSVTVQHQAFADVPDWVVNSTMYKLADQDGDIMVINTSQDEIAAEIGSPDLSKRAKAAEVRKQAAADAETKKKADEDAAALPLQQQQQ